MTRFSAKMLDHFYSPRNAGPLPDAHLIGRSRTYGGSQRTELYLKFDGERIAQVGFTTFGCGSAISAASALTELILGKTIDDCRDLAPRQVLIALDGLPPDKEFCASIAIAALRRCGAAVGRATGCKE